MTDADISFRLSNIEKKIDLYFADTRKNFISEVLFGVGVALSVHYIFRGCKSVIDKVFKTKEK